ncbi:Na(+)-translocating NADH-quinone reductase subunit A [Dongshaea marina]|uniref:Na(+)-translocating NADH-quinone reductase subunit A n=1 Tax=Dongshaea marina TaxID=2047966 RepID=UPI000D3E0F48|nr:Na(+)-translocating NADH-quinone reductase subunit A [Dongshaea marina]
MITIKKGLNLPISGAPEQVVHEGPKISKVAVLGSDYIGMRPTMRVREGETVRQGQALFEDKRNPGVIFTAPASGKVLEINRGAQRALLSVVIEVDESDDGLEFDSYTPAELASLDESKARSQMQSSGIWSALRTRPYSKVPAIDATPRAIFVTAMDSNPLAADASLIIKEHGDDFINGIAVLSRLTEGKVHVCKDERSLPHSSLSNVEEHVFTGPHPSGLPGTHIHFIDPVSAHKTAWYINYQDVIALGQLFVTGKLNPERIISLAGPCVNQPRLVRTRLGASTTELTAGELAEGELRVISGSVLCGRQAKEAEAYLGRYHQQISVIAEDRERELLGWIAPGSNRFSLTRSFFGHFFKGRKFNLTSSTRGSVRSMVPIGSYEKVMPLDILPTLLLRDMLSGDTDGAQSLGCLELDEEDLALCTFVCPCKIEYGPVLRDCLTKIEREG